MMKNKYEERTSSVKNIFIDYLKSYQYPYLEAFNIVVNKESSLNIVTLDIKTSFFGKMRVIKEYKYLEENNKQCFDRVKEEMLKLIRDYDSLLEYFKRYTADYRVDKIVDVTIDGNTKVFFYITG